MKFERILPPGPLQDHVRYFWTLESPVAHPLPVRLGPLADGCPGLIFQPAREGTFCDSRHKPLPEAFLYGQTLTRTAISLVGRFNTVGICFFPGALKSVFGFDAHELTDTCLDAEVVSARLPEALLNAAPATGQLDILSAWLLARIRKTRLEPDGVIRFALAEITGANGRVFLPGLLKDLRLSERSLERRFRQHVGIPPKLFARVCQFQSALHQLKSNRYARLSDVAYDNGYADQSHFIRTFRAFAGVTPYQWQKQAYPVSEHFPVLMR